MKKIYLKEQNQEGYTFRASIKEAKKMLIEHGGGYFQVIGQARRWHESMEGGRWEYWPLDCEKCLGVHE